METKMETKMEALMKTAMETLMETAKENPIGYVYKKCMSTETYNECILMLKKPDHKIDKDLDQNTGRNFQCNETRSKVVDKDFAKFRCNGLIVVVIFDMVFKKTLDWITHRNRNTYVVVRYQVGHYIKPDSFDEDLEKVCGKGIHYFLTMEAAISYNLYWGYCIVGEREYDENGRRIDYHFPENSMSTIPTIPIIINMPVIPHVITSYKKSPHTSYGFHSPNYNGIRLCKSSKKSEPKPKPPKIYKCIRSHLITQPMTKPMARKQQPRYHGRY